MKKRNNIRLALWVAAVTLSLALGKGVVGAAAFVNAGEMKQRDQWSQKYLLEVKTLKPFSFMYGAQSSKNMLSDWPGQIQDKTLDAARTQHTMIWNDRKTGLEVRCVAVEYSDYPVVEWTIYFKNNAAQDTPVLEDIQGLDARWKRGAEGEFVLHGIKGDFCTADSFEPYQLTLTPGLEKQFSPPNSGKSCDGPEGWPYYNLQMPNGGIILAVGWPGQWASSFVRDRSNGLRIKAGQQLTHLQLKPGEEIRTPLIALVFWEGTDVVRAQNLWRRWYMKHVIPYVDGKPQGPLAQIQVGASEENIEYVKKFQEAGIQVDICWRDAGGAHTWYPNQNGPYKGNDSWLNTGTWDIDPERYPKGFKPFSDWVHGQGMKFLLWFEPERVGDPNSWLGQNHPEWLLHPGSVGLIFDEGNPDALAWLINHIDGMIKSQGIDWYREDMNGNGPCPSWRNHDAPDRQGITENFYVQGHLAFWDELKRRNPHLCIDSCASGGRRNDLETMRRSVPLLRSDFQFPTMEGVVEANQAHTYGLSFWLPFQGTGTYHYDSYSFRSFYIPGFGMGGMNPENTAAQQQAYAECRKIAPCMLGDYYPLTAYSRQTDQWIAWQFNRPELGDGVIQAFRRKENPQESQTFRLQGLDPASEYEVTNFDVEGSIKATGKDLMETGLAVPIKNTPGAAVIVYNQVK